MKLNKTFSNLVLYQKNIDLQEKRLQEVLAIPSDHKAFNNHNYIYIKERLLHHYRKRKLLFDPFYDFFTSDLKGKFLSSITENKAFTFL
jgi:hypothetical protein